MVRTNVPLVLPLFSSTPFPYSLDRFSYLCFKTVPDCRKESPTRMSLYANHSSSENSRWKFLFLLSSRSEIYERREHTDCAWPEVDITLSKQRRAANDETVSPRGQSAGAPHSWYVTVYTPPSFFTDFQFHGSFSPVISLI